MKHLAAVTVLLSLLLAGCAGQPYLQPADSARLVPGPRPAARATDSEVTVTATSAAWRWNPTNLDEYVTPMLVEIENNSDRTLRIRLSDFQLLGPNGVELAALPAYNIQGEIRKTVGGYAYASSGFYIVPRLHPFYPRFSVWAGGFSYYPYYFETYYPVYRTYRIALPTTDMLARALPEGTLEPGGKITGFVYFRHIDKRTAKRANSLNLVFELVDADDQREFGYVDIPFVIVR